MLRALASGPLSLWERVRVRGCNGGVHTGTQSLTPALSQRERGQDAGRSFPRMKRSGTK